MTGKILAEMPVLGQSLGMTEVARIEAEILTLTAARGSEKSICPTEVARVFGDEWRRYLGAVRQAAVRLAKAGQIEILRKGKPIEPDAMHGVIRLRVKAGA